MKQQLYDPIRMRMVEVDDDHDARMLCRAALAVIRKFGHKTSYDAQDRVVRIWQESETSMRGAEMRRSVAIMRGRIPDTPTAEVEQ